MFLTVNQRVTVISYLFVGRFLYKSVTFLWRFSWNRGTPKESSISKRIFRYKPSIFLGTSISRTPQIPIILLRAGSSHSGRQNEGVHWEQLGLAREVRGRSEGGPLRQHRQTARAHGEISGYLPHLPWRRQETGLMWAWQHWFWGKVLGRVGSQVVYDMGCFGMAPGISHQRMICVGLLLTISSCFVRRDRSSGCWMAAGTVLEWLRMTNDWRTFHKKSAFCLFVWRNFSNPIHMPHPNVQLGRTSIRLANWRLWFPRNELIKASVGLNSIFEISSIWGLPKSHGGIPKSSSRHEWPYLVTWNNYGDLGIPHLRNHHVKKCTLW